LRRITKAMRDTTGNLPPLPGIFPDQLVPVVRNMESERELTLMRWGFPPSHGAAARLRSIRPRHPVLLAWPLDQHSGLVMLRRAGPGVLPAHADLPQPVPEIEAGW
jgi:putative SOS response-associated peptidase YedK